MLHRFVIRCVSKLERVSDDDDWFLLEKSIKMRPLRSSIGFEVFQLFAVWMLKIFKLRLFLATQPHNTEKQL